MPNQHDAHRDGNTAVVHNAAEHRFEIDINGQLSVLDYVFKNHRISRHHTRHHTSLLQNARFLALLDIAIADESIACWDAKYQYVFWRSVTAIPLTKTDGNPATLEDLTCTPLLITPAHPEYALPV